MMAGGTHKFKFGLLLASISWGYARRQAAEGAQGCLRARLFSAAAEALSYTQPAISQQIAALEKSAGATLVDRTSRGVRLTDAGRALVDHAQVVLARLAAAEAELDAIAGVRGDGAARVVLHRERLAAPPALARFSERHPDVELTFSDTEPEDALQMLRAAELEVAVVFQFHGLTEQESERLYGGIELHPLVEDPMYLALPLGHPLAHKPRVRLQDVADETGSRRRPTQRLQPPPEGGLPVGGLRAEGGLPIGRLQRRPGSGGVGDGRVPAAEPGAGQHARGHRGALARPDRPGAEDRRGNLAGRYRSPATEAMLGILEEVAAGFELPSGTAVAAA